MHSPTWQKKPDRFRRWPERGTLQDQHSQAVDADRIFARTRIVRWQTAAQRVILTKVSA
jgi:hypothetical protein